jgi:hypothetical protein
MAKLTCAYSSYCEYKSAEICAEMEQTAAQWPELASQARDCCRSYRCADAYCAHLGLPQGAYYDRGYYHQWRNGGNCPHDRMHFARWRPPLAVARAAAANRRTAYRPPPVISGFGQDNEAACAEFPPVDDRHFGCETMRRGLSCANQETLRMIGQSRQDAERRLIISGVVAALAAFAGGYYVGGRR